MNRFVIILRLAAAIGQSTLVNTCYDMHGPRRGAGGPPRPLQACAPAPAPAAPTRPVSVRDPPAPGYSCICSGACIGACVTRSPPKGSCPDTCRARNRKQHMPIWHACSLTRAPALRQKPRSSEPPDVARAPGVAKRAET